MALVGFLMRHHTKRSLSAVRRETEDPEIVRQLADLVGIEERLKMLCLLTLVDVEAVSPETLTPWREELLWRLYVDTYNHLTLEYADDRIQHQDYGRRALVAGRPDDLTDAEITGFAEGLPRRYLQLFPHAAIYRHVRLSRDIRPDDVHADLERKDSLWELTVVTLDKPFLFSNICGALSSFGMDHARGAAMPNPHGHVADGVQLTDEERLPRRSATGEDRSRPARRAAGPVWTPRSHGPPQRPRARCPVSSTPPPAPAGWADRCWWRSRAS